MTVWQEILAEVPESEMTTFATSMQPNHTGQRLIHTAFARYEKCPEHIAQKVIAEAAQEN